MKLPKKVLNLFPTWEYKCPDCQTYVEASINLCPNCKTPFLEEQWRVPPRFLENKKVMSDYAHKVLVSKLNPEQRKLLFKYFTEIFSDDFESGDFSAWDGEEDTGDKFGVGSTVVHHGSYAAELANGVAGNSYYVWKGYTQQLPVYGRVYLRLADLPDSSGDWICFLQLGEAATLAKATSAFVKHDGTSAKWFLKNFGYGGTGYGGEVSTDTWYCAEVKRSSTEQVLYINDSVEITVSQAAYGSADEVRVGAVANNDGYGLNGFNCTAYYDCVFIADTYVGPEAEIVSKSISFIYDILSALETISKLLDMKYNIKELISKLLSVPYNLKELISKGISLPYSLKGLISKSLSILHNLKESVSKSVSNIYNIRTLIGKYFGTIYNLKELIFKSLDIK
ncbi:MAG: hypothetical protein ACE5J9_05515, partial [Methanosarcinales archaeon]